MPTNEQTDRVSYRVVEFQWSATISFIKFKYSNMNFTGLVGFVEMIRKVKKHPYWIQQCFFHFDDGIRKIRGRHQGFCAGSGMGMVRST